MCTTHRIKREKGREELKKKKGLELNGNKAETVVITKSIYNIARD